MAKHTITGWITHTQYSWESPKEARIGFITTENVVFPHSEYTVGIQPHSFEIEIPDNFNPNPLKVQGLRAQIEKIKIAAFEEIHKVQQEIEQLLAIGYEAPAPGAVFEDVPTEAIDLNTTDLGDVA